MILFACPLMFLLLPLPFLVRRFLPPVKGLQCRPISAFVLGV